MAVLFKFETQYYENAKIPVTFVGHPLVDKVKPSSQASREKQRLGIQENKRVIGLFPGSRRSEIARLLPVMLDTAAAMQAQDNSLVFVLPVAPTLDFAAIKAECDHQSIEIILTQDNLYDVIVNCDAIVSCSGTVTLEIALLGIPLCIIYKMSWLSYQIMSRLITINHIGLANIVAGQKVVEELLQEDAYPENISQEMFRLLNDSNYREEVIAGLKKVKENLGMGEGSRHMANLINSLLVETKQSTV